MRIVLSEVCGLAAGFIGGIGLIGYMTNNPILYTWIDGTSMAFPTAIATTLLGIGLFLNSIELEK